jgi:hypothetical protein
MTATNMKLAGNVSVPAAREMVINCQDRDFGPFFLKFSSYFPYDAKLCLNGHEYSARINRAVSARK